MVFISIILACKGGSTEPPKIDVYKRQVYAAAVILPVDFKNELLNDSKQLTEHQRYVLREIVEREALAWAVGVVTPEEIDEINILNASFLAMHRACLLYTSWHNASKEH